MAEHLELVAEIPKVEKLTVQERLEYAKKRRKQQLRRWDREKDSDCGPPPRKKKLTSKPVTFEPQFMLLDAATRGDVDEVKKMLENGVDPNISNDDGLTALHQACIDGIEEIIDILLENSANLDGVDRELWTPLHAAAACGNDDIVEYLLDQGASIVSINADGNMPIDLVDDENDELREILHAEMEEQGFTKEKLDELKDEQEQIMLVELKDKLENDDDFDLDMQNDQGATMVHIAAANGYEEVLEFLMEQGAAVDVSDKDGWQPIHGAAVWGNEATVEMLVENGADLDSKTHTGDTPLTLCEDPELQQFLVDLKKKVKTNKGKSSRRKRSNSRSLSVKRTSLKDKITISQNEAKAEAILRVHPQLAFLLPKGTELKNDERKPMDTTPAATEGQSTQNSTTANTNRLQEIKQKENIPPEQKSQSSSLTRVKQRDTVDHDSKTSSPTRVKQSTDPVQNDKTSSLNRVKQKDNIDQKTRDNEDKLEEDKKVVEKKTSFKITVKTRTITSDDKNEEKPAGETKPDVTMGTKDVQINDKLPYDTHPNRRTIPQEPKPDVTMGTQQIHDNHIPIEPQPAKQPRPDVTMVTKPSTLPRDASSSKPPSGLSVGDLSTRSSSDVNIARTNRMPGQKTSGNFSQAGPGAQSTGGSPKTSSINVGLMDDQGIPPKSTKTRHAPAPPLTRSSGSLSRSHEPADTSGYPESFSKRSRTSRENILDVVATGRLASPTHKTATPNDIKLEPAAAKPNQQPQVPQTNKQHPNQTQNNVTKPSKAQPNQQPKQEQNNIPHPSQSQPKPQLREQQPKQKQQPRESYRRRSSSENIAPVTNLQVKDDKEQEKKTCCVLM